MHYLMNNFKCDKLYQLNHEVDISQNQLWHSANTIFAEPKLFYLESINILKHLYEKSNHVKIKGGELYVCYLQQIVIDDEMVDAIGIFKSENKETFLKLKLDQEEEWTVDFQEGTPTSNIDKGCIILNTEGPDGYRVLSIDVKSYDARFWTDDFLGITEVRDEMFQTRAYMHLCYEFANKKYNHKDHNLIDRVEFLSKAKDFFEHYNQFNENEFKEIMLEEDAESLEIYNDTKEEHLDREYISEDVEDGFFISKQAVKTSKKIFKTNIKLDTNVEIKVTSSMAHTEGFIEQGHDEERDMKYYKVYYNNEKQ